MFRILRRNSYPEHIVNKVAKNYLNEKFNKGHEENKPDKAKLCYFTLPYIGKLSSAFKTQFKKVCQKYCKEVNVSLAFQSCKLSSMFSPKDKLLLKSMVVYKFICARCNSCYVGYTTRHFPTRVHEHRHDNKSHIFQHLEKNPECKNRCDETCFKIIDDAKTEYELRIKEAMHIHWLAPTINKQKFSYKMTLAI